MLSRIIISLHSRAPYDELMLKLFFNRTAVWSNFIHERWGISNRRVCFIVVLLLIRAICSWIPKKLRYHPSKWSLKKKFITGLCLSHTSNALVRSSIASFFASISASFSSRVLLSSSQCFFNYMYISKKSKIESFFHLPTHSGWQPLWLHSVRSRYSYLFL